MEKYVRNFLTGAKMTFETCSSNMNECETTVSGVINAETPLDANVTDKPNHTLQLILIPDHYEILCRLYPVGKSEREFTRVRPSSDDFCFIIGCQSSSYV